MWRPGIRVTVFCFSSNVDIWILGFGFHPGSLVTVTLHGSLFRQTQSNVLTTVAGDGSRPGFPEAGEFSIQPTLEIDVVEGTTASTTPVTVTVRDAQGLTVVREVDVRCPAP